MSATKTAEITRNVMVPPARIFIDEKIRTRANAPKGKGVEHLAASIKANSQQTSIIVRPYDGPDTNDYDYTLIAGENRVEACKLLDIDVRADVHPITDEEDAIVAGFVENRDRSELTPLDEYHTVDLLSKRGWKGKDIADRLGVQQAHVSRLKKLSHLSDNIRKMMGDGKVSMHKALALLEIGDESKREKFAADDNMTAERITEYARREAPADTGKGGKGGKSDDDGSTGGGSGATDKQRTIQQVKEALNAALNAPGATPETPVPLGAVAQRLLDFIAGNKDYGVPDWFADLADLAEKGSKRRRK